jgi:8-oxo-dGTP pyrophosphatase MutT (NUDIX family)
MHSPWKPNVTVAAVIERDGRFLLVEEQTRDGLRLNQPAGHLEEGESLIAACVRETLEETAHPFTPEFLLGTYLWRSDDGVTYLRFAFGGTVGNRITGRALDRGIERALWLSPAELNARAAEHRSPLVARCIADYLAEQRFGLDAVLAHPTVIMPMAAKSA